jgi:hypothetical protein
MRHPEVFLVPVLLLLDYFLTVGGSKLAARKYSQHFKFEHYEMNPLWQKTISQGKWLNPKHLLRSWAGDNPAPFRSNQRNQYPTWEKGAGIAEKRRPA